MVPVAVESPLGMAHALKARSTENITASHGGASGMSGSMGTLVRPAGRAQSISSDNITVRMAALSASGNTDSKGHEKGTNLSILAAYQCVYIVRQSCMIYDMIACC
jgi:hypothetical protein